jgi:hypothetical protein
VRDRSGYLHAFITSHQTLVTTLPSYKQTQHFHHKEEIKEEREGKSEKKKGRKQELCGLCSQVEGV